jgi:hypothetical protein
MQLIVQESVPDALPMVYLQQHIDGLQQLLQHVLQMEHQHVPTVAKQRVLQHWNMHLVRQQPVQPHKPVLVQVVVHF